MVFEKFCVSIQRDSFLKVYKGKQRTNSSYIHIQNMQLFYLYIMFLIRLTTGHLG